MKSVLIVGTGGIGERHVRCFQHTGRAEVSGCETNTVVAARVAESYACPVHASLEDALATQAYDAAVVCTPAHTHLGIAKKLLNSGAAVLIEKPLATSSAEVESFCAAHATEAIFVAYVHRFMPVIAHARELARAGHVGELMHIVIAGGQHFPFARPDYRSIYYARRETGGGAIQDLMTHFLHTVEWLAGPIGSLFCDAKHQVLEGVDVEDTVNVSARHRSGVLSSIAVNQFQAPQQVTIQLHGTRGSICAELHQQRVGTMSLGGTQWAWENVPQENRDEAYLAQAHAFLDELAGKPTTLCTLTEGASVFRANMACLESVHALRKVFLPGAGTETSMPACELLPVNS